MLGAAGGIGDGPLNVVKVSVADVRVKVADFTKCVQKTGGSSPREVTQRQRIRSILGMPVAR